MFKNREKYEKNEGKLLL